MEKTSTQHTPKTKAIPMAVGSTRPFLVRKRHSTQVLRCPDLLTLRQWIAEKRLTRDDEVSRAGTKWRKLGGVVEFDSLFYGVEQERLAKTQAGGAAAASLREATGEASTKTGTKSEGPAEKSALGPLKVTPPGLNQVSGNLSLMRLARPGAGKAKPAAAASGTPQSVADKPIGKAAGEAKTALKAPKLAPESQGISEKKAVRPSTAAPVSTEPVEDEDATKKITSSDETRRIERDKKTATVDPIEEAIRKSDPVPKALKDARDITQKIEANEPDEYEQIERQAARRRNGILLLLAGGAALGLYYLLAADQPPQPNPPQPGVEHKTVAGGAATSSVSTAGTPDKPTAEPLRQDPAKTAAAASANTAHGSGATGVAKVNGAEKAAVGAPVGPAPGPIVTPVAPNTPPKPAVVPPLTGEKTALPANPAAQAKPPVVTAPTVAPMKPPVATPPTVAPMKPPVATPPTQAETGTKITSDEVRRIIEQDMPKTFDGQIELANRFFERGKYDQAAAVYQLMLTYAPNVPAIHKAMGDIAFERNQPEVAISHYNDALQIRPTYSAAEFGLAKTYHRIKNDKDQAIAHYLKYLGMNPKGPAAAAARDAITKLGGTPPMP